ncbi:hypothetical protein DCAR_0934065 [Daucus carota subsp. sativus]|uniref:Uncharacterized protein n=1 Tax=Daucus carota subsp. sativus TaxID=79200 RepID=A0A175YFJ3_DAUCS|nr:hypothetical protein DCAR_0934065 [Daucus carota subsp. sativus]
MVRHANAQTKGSNWMNENQLRKEDVRKCELGKDGDFLSELNSSLLLETAINMSVESVESIMAGLGFGEAIIRGLSLNTFIAHFPDIKNLDELDLDFMNIGFKSIKKVEWEDTIPRRRVDVEIRGLPLIAWTKKNCQLLTGKWGDILNYYPLIDSEGVYQVPRIRLETSSTSSIMELVTITVEGKSWNIQLVELTSDSQHFLEESKGMEVEEPPITEQYNVKDDVWIEDVVEVETRCSNNSSKKNAKPPISEAVHNSEKANIMNLSDKISEEAGHFTSQQGKVEDQLYSIHDDNENKGTQEVKDLGDSSDHEESSGSLINPTTPPEIMIEGDIAERTSEFKDSTPQNPNVIEADEGSEDWKLMWQERDVSSDEATATQSLQSQKSSILDDMVEESLEVENSVLINSINKMTIKSRRGRPSKGKGKAKENKAFKVPRRRKIRGMKLGLPVIAADKVLFDEAKFVYDSAIGMGLLSEHSEEKSLQLIRANLGN